MKYKPLERLLTSAWFARQDGCADLTQMHICKVIDQSLDMLYESDKFFGSIYFHVIDTYYFESRHKTRQEIEEQIPLHSKNILNYRKKYLRYVRAKLVAARII